MSEEQDKLKEKRELLKLKQGLIEESEAIPQAEEKPQYEKLHGKKAVENFFYHYKWRTLAIVLTTLALGFLIYTTITKERPDLNVVITTRGNYADLNYKVNDLEKSFELYCPDYNGNGKVHVNVMYIDMSESYDMDYQSANMSKFFGEIATGTAQLYIVNPEIVTYITEASGVEDFFINLSETYPEAELYENIGVQVRGTGFAENAHWLSCPKDIYLLLREPFDGLASTAESTATERAHAAEVLDNIINNRIINAPAAED